MVYFYLEKNIVTKKIIVFQSRQFAPTVLEGQNLGLTPRPKTTDFLGFVFSFLWVFLMVRPTQNLKLPERIDGRDNGTTTCPPRPERKLKVEYIKILSHILALLNFNNLALRVFGEKEFMCHYGWN